MTNARLLAALAFLLLLIPHSGIAYDNSSAFEVYVRSPNTRLAVELTMREQAQNLPGWCFRMEFIPRDLEVLEEVSFTSGGILHEGVWKDSWQSTGCDADRVYNVLTMVRHGGIVERRFLLPGTTRAAPLIQKEIVPKVLQAANINKQIIISCSENRITDTAYLGTEKRKASTEGIPLDLNTQPWREDWLVSGCGKNHLVALHFTPNAKGGADVDIDPSETRTQ